MCEMLGLSARRRRTANVTLREFFAHAERHPHGWGLARFPDTVGRDVPIAPQAVMFAHDPDGNLTNDCTFAYSYDAENRLASVASNGVVFVSNQYDYRGRRIRKSTPTAETTFTYDGWNLIHETVATIQGAITNTTEIQYFWGMDLSETMQGAGGVGGMYGVQQSILVEEARGHGHTYKIEN